MLSKDPLNDENSKRLSRDPLNDELIVEERMALDDFIKLSLVVELFARQKSHI